MKTKVLILDYLGNSNEWINNFINSNNVDIVNIITLANKEQQKAIIVNSSWNYILIFEQNMRNTCEQILSDLEIQVDKIIYALDISSWIKNVEAIYTILKPREMQYTVIHRYLDLFMDQRMNNFITCTTNEGISYIATSKDKTLMQYIYLSRRTWASDEIDAFHELSQKYYYNNDEGNEGGGISRYRC